MKDQQPPYDDSEPHEDNLSAFEDALDESLFDSLPESDLSTKDDRSIGERARDVIQELAQEYGIEIIISSGREFGYELALNFRLGDMIGTSPGPISDEISLAIQRNQVSEEQADELYASLTDADGLDYHELSRIHSHVFNMYQVIEIVAGDPQQLFITDLESQSRILRCLQSSAESVQDYLEHVAQSQRIHHQ